MAEKPELCEGVCPAGAWTARAENLFPNAEIVTRFTNFLGLNITREEFARGPKVVRTW